MPLSDTQQAELSIASYVLLVIGATTIPAGVPWYVGLAIALLGAVGIGIKEYLGAESKPAKPPAPGG